MSERAKVIALVHDETNVGSGKVRKGMEILCDVYDVLDVFEKALTYTKQM